MKYVKPQTKNGKTNYVFKCKCGKFVTSSDDRIIPICPRCRK